jgi:hypothetical protein
MLPFHVASIVLPLTLIFWGGILWAAIVAARALRNIGVGLQRIATEMERRNRE